VLDAGGELAPELADGPKNLVGSAKQPDAALQIGKGPFRTLRR
jgi:hypothetical protein